VRGVQPQKGPKVATLKLDEMAVEQIREGVERRLGHTDNLMIVVIDFDDGPTSEPDPPHSHPHEQVSYVAEGEILFVMEGRQTHLKAGDLFLVPSGAPHTIQQLTKHVRLVDCFTPIREDFL
jgi:quercetin dioxygenase-like cupin family protein